MGRGIIAERHRSAATHTVRSGPEAPTRVLFVNTRHAIGADVAVHLMLVRNLSEHGCDVHLATAAGAAEAMVRDSPGVTIRVLHLGYELAGRARLRRMLAMVGNALVLPLALLRLAWWVRAIDIEVIHSTERPRDALVSTTLALITGRTAVIHCHNKAGASFGRVTNWGLRRSHAVIAISEFVRHSLVATGLPGERVFTAHNAVDPERFDPAHRSSGAPRLRLGIAPEAPLVGVVGRVMVWKGQLELVRAMAEVRRHVPDARLLIAGEACVMGGEGTGYEARVQRCVEQLGLATCVHRAGRVENVADLYAQLDVVCVPSYEEPFGLVLVEAMAAGRAIVASASGAIPEIVRHGVEALLVPPRDPGPLAEAVLTLLEDPGLRKDLGARARARALSRFSPARQAEEVATIYRSFRAARVRERTGG